MKKNTINFSLSLLCSAIWKETDCQRDFLHCIDRPLTDEEWKDIIKFFTLQTLDGLLPDAIALLSPEKQPSNAIKMPIIVRQLKVERMNNIVNQELLSFTKELNKREIPYFVLKGQGVAALYPHPLHRTCGDIDLYVHEQYLKDVGRGFNAFGAIRTNETRHHINYQARDVEWELHHHIYYFQKEKRNHIFMRYVEEAIRKTPEYITIEGEKVRVMPPVVNIMTLLAHILDHFYCEGVGIRQLCDFALMLHHKKNEIYKTEFLEALDRLSLTRSYRIFGYLCVHYLGLPEEDLLLQATEKEKRLAHKVMDDCLKGGNFGYAYSNPRVTLGQKTAFYARFLHRLWQYKNLCPSEALWWPIAKLWRAVTGRVSISEEQSAINCSLP